MLVAIACLAIGRSAPIFVQEVTTAAIRGTVHTAAGERVDGALDRVVNEAAGYAIETKVRGDAFVVRGLETRKPYRILVMGPGYSPQVLD